MEADPPLTASADLLMKFYASRAFSSSGALGALDSVLRQNVADWYRRVRVVPEWQESSTTADQLGDRALGDVLAAVAPMRFGMCAVNLQGDGEGIMMFLQCSRNALPPESNVLTVEVKVAIQSLIEGKPIYEWARSFFVALVGAVPLRYAHARTRAEFEAKNMFRQRHTAKAVGVNLKRSLPGLYWLNFFGPDYTELMGRACLAAVPAPIVESVGDGVCVGLGDTPLDWNTEGYKQREAAVVAHLGAEYFFSKSDPNRTTRAPIFKAEREL
jgi:hypothetical protein